MSFREGEFNGQPTIYEPCFDVARMEPTRSIQRYLDREASQFAHKASRDLAQMVEKAYVAGLHDGFVQGVAAAMDRKEQA